MLKFNFQNLIQMYNCITKILISTDPRTEEKTYRFITYHNVTCLLKFTTFLDTKKSGWVYFNVYNATTRAQITSYTINERPQSKI